jgi:hypothetical protein
MSKKALYFEEAERLYVVEQLSLSEIANRIPVSERTLRSWKEEANWDTKRSNFLSQRTSFHNELYDFTRELLTKVREDIAADKDPNSGQLYTLMKLLDKLNKVKDYEEETQKEDKNVKKDRVDEDLISIIERDVFGMKK